MRRITLAVLTILAACAPRVAHVKEVPSKAPAVPATGLGYVWIHAQQTCAAITVDAIDANFEPVPPSRINYRVDDNDYPSAVLTLDNTKNEYMVTVRNKATGHKGRVLVEKTKEEAWSGKQYQDAYILYDGSVWLGASSRRSAPQRGTYPARFCEAKPDPEEPVLKAMSGTYKFSAVCRKGYMSSFQGTLAFERTEVGLRRYKFSGLGPTPLDANIRKEENGSWTGRVYGKESALIGLTENEHHYISDMTFKVGARSMSFRLFQDQVVVVNGSDLANSSLDCRVQGTWQAELPVDANAASRQQTPPPAAKPVVPTEPKAVDLDFTKGPATFAAKNKNLACSYVPEGLSCQRTLTGGYSSMEVGTFGDIVDVEVTSTLLGEGDTGRSVLLLANNGNKDPSGVICAHYRKEGKMYFFCSERGSWSVADGEYSWSSVLKPAVAPALKEVGPNKIHLRVNGQMVHVIINDQPAGFFTTSHSVAGPLYFGIEKSGEVRFERLVVRETE